jgi:hypothetical protein
VIENIVYSYDPAYQPAIQYYSIPSSCSGGANTLDEARSSYRSDMAGLMGVSRYELPPVIEHLEAVVAGRWVRTRVGALHRDRISGRMFLQTLLSSGQAQDDLRAHLDAATAASSAPVVLIVEPEDTLGTVLDQMTPRDALWVTYSESQNVVGWVAIYGPEADGIDNIPHTFHDAGLRNMPIDAFARAYACADSRTVRVRPYPLPNAS